MTALQECQKQGFLFRVFGGCEKTKFALNKCLRAARLERTKENLEKSRAKNEKVKMQWSEIDKES
jgi:COX assembly mitochondrial protein 2